MVRKKPEKTKMAANDTTSELKAVRLLLPPDLHQRFRVEAAMQGTSMAVLARRLIEDYMAKRPKRAN